MQNYFINVLLNWITITNLGKIDIENYLNDENALMRVSNGFSRRSEGILRGAIGAIDRWLVKIQHPSENKDNISNLSSFFSRKGFYALNVQTIVDHEDCVSDALSRIHKAHELTSGGFISGEVKLAITLRMLAGGSSAFLMLR